MECALLIINTIKLSNAQWKRLLNKSQCYFFLCYGHGWFSYFVACLRFECAVSLVTFSNQKKNKRVTFKRFHHDLRTGQSRCWSDRQKMRSNKVKWTFMREQFYSWKNMAVKFWKWKWRWWLHYTVEIISQPTQCFVYWHSNCLSFFTQIISWVLL